MEFVPATSNERNRRLIRSRAQQIYRRLLENRSAQVEDFSRSALIFAPHPDDETIGCGGTIVRKRQAGASVKIIFMTDGSLSHAHLIEPTELANMRHTEAVQACKALGVNEEDLIFLNFPDENLVACAEAAQQQITQLLEVYQPEEVFLPYRGDITADHVITWRVVSRALHATQSHNSPNKRRIYEYPVWFWYHWPWVSLNQPTPKQKIKVILQTLRAILLFQLFARLQKAVDIRAVLNQKRFALEQHATQMIRFNDSAEWLTLWDVSDGEFLACFFQPDEFFYCYAL